MKYYLRISGYHYKALYDHLFPGDGKEAVAIALCGRQSTEREKTLFVHEVFLIPYSQCERDEQYVNWKTDSIIPFIEKASSKRMGILKIHSHPTGYQEFSKTDDMSDSALFPSIYGWMEDDDYEPHASAVMLPSGRIFGRVVTSTGSFVSLSKISVAGDQILLWDYSFSNEKFPEAFRRNRQTFGKGTTEIFGKLKVGVIGASGTGSPTIEQLARLGVGSIVIVDPDKVEKKNLNRILNSFDEDAEQSKGKVDIIKSSIDKMGFGTKVKAYEVNLFKSREAIYELSSCDVLIGCVDSVDGRDLINKISSFYIIPYMDIGVKLEADGVGGIDQINGVAHYIQPGGSSLYSRGVYNKESLLAASLFRQRPEEYEKQKKEAYIVNVAVESPAVISVNMFVSSYAVNELLDRIHTYKNSLPASRAISWLSLTENLILTEEDGPIDRLLRKYVGLGDVRPLLNDSEL